MRFLPTSYWSGRHQRPPTQHRQLPLLLVSQLDDKTLLLNIPHALVEEHRETCLKLSQTLLLSFHTARGTLQSSDRRHQWPHSCRMLNAMILLCQARRAHWCNSCTTVLGNQLLWGLMYSKEFVCSTVNLVKAQLPACVKLASKYLCFHLWICSMLNLGRRSFFLLRAAVNTETHNCWE